MRQPYNGWAVGLSYHGSRKSFNSALQMLIFTASELQIRKNWVIPHCEPNGLNNDSYDGRNSHTLQVHYFGKP